MKLRSMALVLLVVTGVLVACHGTSYVPQTDESLAGAPQAVAPHLPPGLSLPDVTNICAHIPFASVPGQHIEMIAEGHLKGARFTGAGFWFLVTYKRGKPGPTPTPGVTPTPNRAAPEWLYYGSYSLKSHKESGCAFLIATKSGKPFKGSHDNAIGVGAVVVRVKYLKTIPTTTMGPLTMRITGISATGGRGGASLLMASAPYDTAKITLTGRVLIP